MKKNTLTIIIICGIALVLSVLVVFIVGTLITSNQMNDTANEAQCINDGGMWQNGKCIK